MSLSHPATLGQGGVPRVLSKAARQALLTYFIHDLPKEGQGRSGDDDCDAAERDEEGGNCGGEGERTGDVAGKHDAAPVSSSPPVSLGAAVPVVTAGAPTTTSRKLWLEMEDDRERGLASKATKTFAVTEGTSARERPSSDDQQPGGASAPHTGEGAPACNERPRGPTHPDIEKGRCCCRLRSAFNLFDLKEVTAKRLVNAFCVLPSIFCRVLFFTSVKWPQANRNNNALLYCLSCVCRISI